MPKKKPKPIDPTEELADAIPIVKFVLWSVQNAEYDKLIRMREAVRSAAQCDSNSIVFATGQMLGPMVERELRARARHWGLEQQESTDAKERP